MDFFLGTWLITGGIGAFACAERHLEDTSFPYVKHDAIMRLIGARTCCQSRDEIPPSRPSRVERSPTGHK
ncbi:hypothetical protein HBI88_078160 [Parastagonospora nodorum]|nr:hypothetical protein HBI97_027720 [Parastagonospora nodorum]KAH5816301.1 hypothetical protein HBI96_068050 [Parastagonospora nodorum]KAH5829538.1 hypothetical protein HBI94_052490 [Parastagonospora nodorum]KAH5837473.1 hypothetical protein HBI93_085820 [Parastagonospora nodorum]KAH5863256.1 hypothetical protein HBI91_119810 [Parastagonospora nodorum]